MEMLVKEKGFSKDFIIMVAGQIISILGSALLRFALSLFVLDITGRADLFAALFAISSLPVLLTPFGGAIADRFNRRNLMVLFDFISSGIVLIFFIVLLTDNHSVLWIGLVMVLLSFISAMYTPAVMASIPLLVSEQKLEQANGIVNGVQALAGVTAPVLGGILYGMLGLKLLVIVSGLLFFFTAIVEMFMTIPFVKRSYDGHLMPTLIKDMKEGFTYVVTQTFILKCTLLAALLNLLLTPLFIVGVPIILRVTMKSSDTLYGIGMGIIDFATILGALTMGYFAKKLRIHTLYIWVLMSAFLVIPMAMSVLPRALQIGYYPSYSLFIGCALIIAMMMTIISIYVMTLVQKETPNEQLGKVMAIMMAVSQCMAPLGQMGYGLLFEFFQANIYIPVFIISVCVLLLAFVTRRIWRLEVK
ncbi:MULTISPECIES: MFS transporter [Lysinibacillus]|uniref:MFS transporter n=1 Tax=Lysinibacillus TaxID=400634 RepID=UPI0021A59EC6|nr:MFS transporter [Lysinibacillus capsici]MCT1539631.1 MFS transporter [Lysinibacillus capsici]MCT1570702.1 MFS transporter [Lysinibacillus capsici]MCT1648105.1 MFS transporter [Lysinibacillus capsici]MCT1726647.1 MFS transporter [Lysinibacillus capsici]MCT1783968.1 MFS transporter [Lysinibacillus capsici]